MEMFVSQSQNFHWIRFLMSNWLKIHIGSVVGLAPKSDKSLSEPMITQVTDANICLQASMG